MIRKIHQTWKNASPPESKFNLEWVDSWQALNPGWEYKLWTDEDLENYVLTRFPSFYPVWCSYPKNIMRVDAWRYLVLQDEGGLYVDLDIACLRPIDSWISQFVRFACPEQGDGIPSNAFMWAPERNLPFFEHIEASLCEVAYEPHPFHATGPEFLGRYLLTHHESFQQIPTRDVFPVTVWDRAPLPELREAPIGRLRESFPDAFSISLWTGSWVEQPNSMVEPRLGASAGILPADLFVAVSLTPDMPSARVAHQEFTERHRNLWCRYYESVASQVEEDPDVPRRGPAFVSDLSKAMGDFLDSGLKWLLVCSDQTYFVPERTCRLISEGAQFICNESLLVDGRPDVRAGYLISRELALAMHERKTVRDEESVADYLSDTGTLVDFTPLLRQDRFRYPIRSNTIASTATDNPKYFRVLSLLAESVDATDFQCAHQYWTGTVTFLGEGLCIRHATGCAGSWLPLEGGHRMIHWFDWPPELMFQVGERRGYVAFTQNTEALTAPVLPVAPLSSPAGEVSFPRSGPAQGEFRLPRIIHQTWRTESLPGPIGRCVRSVKERHPAWHYQFWTDEDWHDLVAGNPFISPEEFWRIPTGIQRADVARMLALHRFGGVYMDVDVLCLRPLESLIESAIEAGVVGPQTEVILTTDHPVHCVQLFSGQELLMNDFMIAKPGSRFAEIYLSSVRKAFAEGDPGTDPVSSTGPLAMTRWIEEHGGCQDLRIAVLPYFWIHPLPDMNLVFPGREAFHEIITNRTWKERFCPYFVHCWWHNYHSDRNMMQEYGDSLFEGLP